MCRECFRLMREHTLRERRSCEGRPSLVEAPPAPEPTPTGLTIDEVRRVVADMLPEEHPDSDVSRAGILLLSAFQVGTTGKALREFTGLPWTVITNGGFYARRCGIWRGRMIRVDWEEPDPVGYIAFVADCMVVAGRIVRETRAGTIRYRMRTLGDYSATRIEGLDEVPWDEVARPELREQRRLARAGQDRAEVDRGVELQRPGEQLVG